MAIGLYGLEERRRLVLQQSFQHPKTGKVYAEDSDRYRSAVAEYTEAVCRFQQHRQQLQRERERQAQLQVPGVPRQRGLYELWSHKQFILGWMFHNLKTGMAHPPDSPRYFQALQSLQEVERQMDEQRAWGKIGGKSSSREESGGLSDRAAEGR